MQRWSDYRTTFQQRYDRLKGSILQSGSTEIGPFINPISKGHTGAPWRTDWAIIFSDGLYVRAKECFGRCAGFPPQMGQRQSLSFHYGEAHAGRDNSGMPLLANAPAAIIRIDLDPRQGPHLHYEGEDHIPQSRVDGFSISDADLFNFMEAISQHRRNGVSLLPLFNIKLRP